MSKKKIIFIVIVAGLLIVAYNTLFFIEQRIQAIVLQFGEPVKVIQEPGLNFKIPFAQNVIKFDKRILLFDNNAEEI